MPTTTRIVRIGNSKGIRIPKALLDRAELPDDVELRAEPGRLVVQAVRKPRKGWEAAAQAMRAAGDDALLDSPIASAFDDQEWEWSKRLGRLAPGTVGAVVLALREMFAA